MTSIGGSAFYGCSGLTSITIPESVTSIGGSAFYGCNGLTSINIPKGVTSIGEKTFSGCSSLTSITISEGVTSIGDGAFYGCNGLTSITIPESVTSIGGSAFYGCSGLTSITIPESVTSIGENAYFGCSGLKTISIGAGITSIGTKAFAECKKIEDVYCYAVRYPQTATDAFENSYPDYITLHVPEEGVKQYKAVAPWSTFNDVVAIDEILLDLTEIPAQAVLVKNNGGALTIEGVADGTEIFVYDINGIRQGKAVSRNGKVTISTNLTTGSVAVIKIGKKSLKVLIR